MVVVNHWMMVDTSLVVVDKWKMSSWVVVDQWMRSSLVVDWWAVHSQCVEGGVDGCLGFGV